MLSLIHFLCLKTENKTRPVKLDTSLTSDSYLKTTINKVLIFSDFQFCVFVDECVYVHKFTWSLSYYLLGSLRV